ncbi:hypothetical protein LJR231_005586 [Phyllobacterium sp. LjRoot231]|uniref:hypothetical protein n=1 Tax=Phyllobacterium sp. LjRoot231 TaxID=3342289 RepID=UPI003ECF6F05
MPRVRSLANVILPFPSSHRDIAHVGGLVDLGGAIVAITQGEQRFALSLGQNGAPWHA